MSSEMTAVTRDVFFSYVNGPRNIHPRCEREFSAWEEVGTRLVVGKTTPGYANTYRPDGREEPRSYMLTPAAIAELSARKVEA